MVDNDWYDTLGDGWHDAHGPMALLQQMNPTRAAYFLAAIQAASRGAAQPGSDSRGRGPRVLDVGCGGGYLAESLARAGCAVSAVDRSAGSIAAARRHAEAAGLPIAYHAADARRLPFPDASFDAVISSDFLEHVAGDLDAVVAEQARVLRAGGVLGFETVNRTWRSRLVLIWLAQDILRIVPRHLHAYALFIRPAELARCLERHGVVLVETRGMVPARSPIAFLAGYLARHESGGFRLGRSRAISYIGYGITR
ncbi:MAG TPA: bifunctional 2-polyprenyl-6-hydroxyphenol methylase/3-demethylubiquinol 3-O-methyltransferase UbiG [Ktedonobacterales bacterium]